MHHEGYQFSSKLLKVLDLNLLHPTLVTCPFWPVSSRLLLFCLKVNPELPMWMSLYRQMKGNICLLFSLPQMKFHRKHSLKDVTFAHGRFDVKKVPKPNPGPPQIGDKTIKETPSPSMSLPSVSDAFPGLNYQVRMLCVHY